jgi:hypothetical protein
VEQGKDVRDARQFIYRGDRAYADGDQASALKAYEQGLRAWRKVLDAHREYLTEQTSSEDLLDMIKRYRHVLSQADRPFPEPFVLQDVIDIQQRQFGAPPLQEEKKKPQGKTTDVKKPDVKKPDARKADVKKPDFKKPDNKKTAVEKADVKKAK